MNWFHPHALQRRAQVTGYVVAGIVGILAVAFFRVQILRSDRYRLQSDENRLRAIPLTSPRGLIVDRNGVVLADNVPGYSVSLLVSSPESLMAETRRIAPIAGLKQSDFDIIAARYRRAPFDPVVIMRDAPFDVVSALEERRITMPGLIVETEPKRHYPFADTTAHLVGYVGEVTESELQRTAYPGVRPGMLVGREGLERVYDAELRGDDGVRFIEVDALGRTIRAGVGTRLQPRQGDTLRTTLDVELQRFVAELFPEGARGGVVALEPESGAILALYSSPSYDPNLLVEGLEDETWKAIIRSQDRPLFDRAIQGRYPPASPFKLALAAMALKRGIVTMDSHMPIPCRGGMQYGNRYFRCWKQDGHGDLSLREAIQHSCDVYFYQLGLQLGLENLLHDGIELGFARRTGVDLPGEVTPFFPTSTSYYDRTYGPRGWTRAVTLNLAIGQGENDQSLIGMVEFYAALANRDGVAVRPHLVESNDGAGAVRRIGLDRTLLAGLREALLAVVDSGTAQGARIAKLAIAGKTGTAQNPHGRDHGWFIGFAPAESPEIVVGAIVEFAEHGSAVAPLVTSIIARHLLGPEARNYRYRLIMPSDSAPEPEVIIPERNGNADSTDAANRNR